MSDPARSPAAAAVESVMGPARLFVVVPFYNEAQGMQATFDALQAQDCQDFSMVLVNNASTDNSRALAEAFARSRGSVDNWVIDEAQKGTGAASDTGFRFAIAMGATAIARTDADCVPRSDWVRRIRHAMFNEQLEFVGGRIAPRIDEKALTMVDRLVLPAMIAIAENFGRVIRRGPQFMYPYFMAAGNNLAITASLYVRAGGFPRTSIEEMHEDRALSEMVRTLTTRAARRDDLVVYNSARRVHAYGYLNTLRWYRNHGYKPAVVDVR